MAYTRQIEHRCDEAGCSKRATMEVFNNFNASYGRYCGPHARQKVERLDREQKASQKPERPAYGGK